MAQYNYSENGVRYEHSSDDGMQQLTGFDEVTGEFVYEHVFFERQLIRQNSNRLRTEWSSSGTASTFYCKDKDGKLHGGCIKFRLNGQVMTSWHSKHGITHGNQTMVTTANVTLKLIYVDGVNITDEIFQKNLDIDNLTVYDYQQLENTYNTYLFNTGIDIMNETVVVKSPEGKIALIFNQTKEKKLEGQWVNFHDTGEVWENSYYINGQKDGVSCIYKRDGTVLQQNIYKAGKRCGEHRMAPNEEIEVYFYDGDDDVTEKVLPLVDDIKNISDEERMLIKIKLNLDCIERRIEDSIAENDPMRGMDKKAEEALARQEAAANGDA